MTQGSTKTSNQHYDLVSALYHLLEAANSYDTYIKDAQQAKDNELVTFFQELKQQHSQQAERAQSLLAQRMGK